MDPRWTPRIVALTALRLVRRRIGRALLHRVRRPGILRRTARPGYAHVLGLRLRTEPDVFHPVYYASSRILAQHVVAARPQGLSLLDMGTGSGVIALAAAAAGGVVTACDVNPSAVALTRANAALNGLAVEVLQSDLFEAPAFDGREFDLIVFNIPFYPHTPRSDFERAFRAGPEFATVKRFAAGCAHHLSDGGRVMIVFSEDCDRGAALGPFGDAGLLLEGESVTRRGLELFSVATFARAPSASSPRR